MNLFFRRTGRLGNHIFIYAFARALATELHAELFCDTRWHGPELLDELHNFPNLHLQLAPAPPDAPVIRHTDKYTPQIYGEVLSAIRSHSPSDVVLEGFLQGYYHLAVCETRLRAELFLPTLSTYEDCIGLHVRRTDFLYGSFYLDLSLQWYIDAIDRLLSQVRSKGIIIFSDDVPWCEANLRSALAARFGDCICDTSPAFVAFHRMRSCAGLAISNSTFSWWAAWLAQVPTVCPIMAVFNHAEHYYLPSWTKLAQPESLQRLLASCPNRTRNSMEVRKAIYGSTHFVDVTDLINRLLKEGCAEFLVSNELGGDPEGGVVKQLVVEMESGKNVIFTEGTIAHLCD